MKLQTLCGLIDGFVVVVAAFVLAAFEGFSPLRLVSEKWGVLLTLVLPVSMLVTWRGRAHSARLLSGQRSWLWPVVEGFAWGFLLLPVADSINMIKDAAAAGPTYPEFGSPTEVWFSYFKYLSLYSSMLGAAGAVLALALSSINRAIIRWIAR